MPTAAPSRNGSQPVLVCRQTPEGVSVYNPNRSDDRHLVAGTRENPSCTCEEFADTNGAGCRHVDAAHDLLPPEETLPAPNGTDINATMLLKRSVSPDGRIDSLSVEFSCPVAGLDEGTILRKARRALGLQGSIAEEFRDSNPPAQRHEPDRRNGDRAYQGRANGNGNGGNGAHRNGNGRDDGNHGDGNVFDATVLEVGGTNTRFGFKLFLVVDVDGDRLKLFGSKKQLADQLSAAGYPNEGRNLTAGMRLDLPCRATTQPSKDGQYVNVESLLPPARAGRPEARR